MAKISREGLRYAFSEMLAGMTPIPQNLHIGLLARDDWVWIDGSPVNGSLWNPGNSITYKETQRCGVLSAGSSRIKNVDCFSRKYPLCQKQPGRLQHLFWGQILMIFSYDCMYRCNIVKFIVS